jgi:hypothetical protein
MAERCPTCTLRFERVHGHWIGSLGTNTTVVFGVMFVVLLAGSLLSFPEPPGMWLLWVEVALAVAGPVLFFPASRMIWTAIDLLMRPLVPGELDPRFVERDPDRDDPMGP